MTGRRAASNEADAGSAAPSTVETVYMMLMNDIISGKRQPGEFLRIDRMSRAYGVGPTPLRETLQRLTAENFVIAHGGKGFQVAPLTIEEFEDLNIARMAIELEALRLSIKHGDEAWEARVVAAGYILQKWDAQISAGASDKIDKWESANAEFHSALLAGCPSKWLLRTQEGLRNKCERYRRSAMVHAGPRYHEDVVREHKAMLEAALARDAEKGCELLATHYNRTLEAFRTVFVSGQLNP